MAYSDYSWQKLLSAVLGLASGHETVQERLRDAYKYNLYLLESKDFPEELQDAFNSIKNKLTKNGEQSADAITQVMTEDEATLIAEEVVGLFDQVAQALGVAKKQAEIDLTRYNLRFKVFEALKTFLSHIVREADVSPEKILQFGADTSDSLIIFDEEISEYFKEVRQKAGKLYSQVQQLHHSNLPIGNERNQLAEEHEALLSWFTEQLDYCQHKFAKYLK